MSLSFVSGGLSKPSKFGEYGEADEKDLTSDVTEIGGDKFVPSSDTAKLDGLLLKAKASTAVADDVEEEDYIPEGLLPADVPPDGYREKKIVGPASGSTLYEQLQANNEAARSAMDDANTPFQPPKALDDDEIEFLENARRQEEELEKLKSSVEQRELEIFARAREKLISEESVKLNTGLSFAQLSAPKLESKSEIKSKSTLVVIKRKEKGKGKTHNRKHKKQKVEEKEKEERERKEEEERKEKEKKEEEEKKRKEEEERRKEEEERKRKPPPPKRGLELLLTGYGSDSDSYSD